MVSLTELFGYIASFFVAISLLMSSFLWLRVLNLIGAAAFVTYGALLGSIPVLITNAFITIIDVVYLVRMLRPDLNGVRYIAVGSEQRGRLDDFVAHHLEDILKFFPDFSTDRISRCLELGGLIYLAYKDITVVGFALVQPVPDPETEDEAGLREVYRNIHADLFPERSLVIPVDYITRRYRGLGLVHQLYHAVEYDAHDRAAFVLTPVRRGARRHERFLRQTGYSLHSETSSYLLYAKALNTRAAA